MSRSFSKPLLCPVPREIPSAITIRMRPRPSPASQCDCCKISAWKGGNCSCFDKSAVGPPVLSVHGQVFSHGR